jgi:hypothetical protein
VTAYEDLRGFIEQVDKLGALRRIEGADPLYEVGGITEVAAGSPECPALLFDALKGLPRGVRIFTNATVSAQRAALALGIDPHLPPIEALREWGKRRVFIHARTHPAEVQAFYVIREAMRFLLSGDTAAVRLRRDFIFNFVPMYNPDGVELGKARWNAHDTDLESNWDARPMEPEPTALKRTFMDFMSGPIPIEVALNLHSDQYNCARFFFFHYAEGTSARYAELEKTYIGGVQAHYPGGIKDWGFVKSWLSGTVTHYPEGFWWVNHGDKVMALTYEDNNSITATGAKCPPAGGFDSTGSALVLGTTDYMEGRSASPILARRAPVTRTLLERDGVRFPPGSAARWEVLDPRGRRLASGSIGREGGMLAWREVPDAPMRILSVRPETGPAERLILPFR